MRWAAFLLTGALAALSPAGVSAAVTTSYDAARSTLHVESDAADEIVVACMSNQTIVNGLPPASGPVGCSDVVTLLVNGGPGSNRIDLSGAALGSFSSKGISSSASVSAGAGDDHIVGPAGAVVTRLEGGSGSDRIEGRAYDTYVFGQAFGAEADTIVEPGSAACDPAFAETDQPNLSYWTVPGTHSTSRPSNRMTAFRSGSERRAGLWPSTKAAPCGSRAEEPSRSTRSQVGKATI